MIRITPTLSLHDDELTESFVRSSGPGGQNVNKVSTAVELRFDVRNSPSLTEAVKARLTKLGGHRMTKDGVLIIQADRFRTQEANRKDARDRLIELIIAATFVPKKRIKTKPTRASKERRVDGKKKRSTVKKMRQSSGWE
jgi:ribosome-associated protein